MVSNPIVLLLLAAALFVSDEAPTESTTMVERLAQIARDADPARDPSMNIERARLRAQRLRDPATPAGEKATLFVELSLELLRAGATEQAISNFQQLKAGGDQQGADPTKGLMKQLREYLAVCHLRLAEQRNCVAAHGPESCIIPIEGSGIHQEKEGALSAIEALTALLRDFPDDVGYRWLLNVAYMAVGDYPDGVPEAWLIAPSVFESDAAFARFTNKAGPMGIDVNALSGGAIMEDFDGDGWLDIMASSWGLTDQLRYFRNAGDGTFSDLTETAGLSGQVGGLNLCHADYDNDGDADVLVLRGAWRFRNGHHPNSLLRNRGDGTFEDVTEAAGVLSFHPTQTAAWADFDGDGWLDLFIGNESTSTDPHRCELYRNNGDGTFRNVAPDVGVDHDGFVKAVAWGDYDNDGDPDLFLSRFGQPNVLFRNDRGAFREVTAEAGVAEPAGSFPAWFWDYDNDGWLDLLVAPYGGFDGQLLREVVADMLGMPTDRPRVHLYRNQRDGTFENVAPQAGLHEVMLAMGANFGDLDNDGWLDAYFGTGEPDLATIVPNRMFAGRAGQTFADVTTAGGFGHLQKGHGIAFGDIDNDGDQDIFAVMGGAYQGDVYPNVFFENPGMPGRRWVTLMLRGKTSNRAGHGARVRVVVVDTEGRERTIHRVVGTGGSFGSSSLQLEVGLGRAARIERIEIAWPGAPPSAAQTCRDVPLNAHVVLREGDAGVEVVERAVIALPGGDGSSGSHHQHH